MTKIPDGDWLSQLHESDLDDFWQRRANALRFRQEVRLFGHPLVVESNEAEVLAAVEVALQNYTQTAQNKPPLGTL
ncbi:MAG: hypothetical protein WAS33_03590, partial [Candidatus Promineifilaceae bacterium]